MYTYSMIDNKEEISMKVVVLFADGFEEIEAVTPVDVLRRAGADMQMLSITDILGVTGAHGIKILADGILTGDEDVDAVVLPGGLPGAINLSENEKVLKLVRAQYEKAGVVAAICAAPIVLDRAGVLVGRNFTCYPGFEENFETGTRMNQEVVVDDHVVTGMGPALAMDFSLQLVEQLLGKEKRDEVAKGLLVE